MAARGGDSAPVMASEEVREVWGWNMGAELPRILDALDSAPYAAVDTEFPGFLHQTPWFATPRERYQDVRRNVDSLKLIQLGFTFFGDGSRRRTWQISFRDFDVFSPSDARSEASVELLKRSGVDFSMTRTEGVDSEVFSELLRRCDWLGRRKPRWVTFQGLYDVAYLVKLLTGAPLPATLPRFAQLVGAILGKVIDVKYLTRFCGGFDLGLARLSESLGVKVEGGAAHQAGFDTLLTARVFEWQMERLRGREEDFEGILHGIEEERIIPLPKEETGREELLICRHHPPILIGMTAPLPGFYVGRIKIFF
ncbi:unnamed protein product [Spirodela intermedia]|uniref:poly(A)-specific ribonuclease n=1 Tax=Spirodela intermedia TaxID=51605 RepID=A0A7I8KB53_SPIIN|nr:unnamed protein product [Spirodela intermedia]